MRGRTAKELGAGQMMIKNRGEMKDGVIYLEPYDHQIPETNHGDFSRRGPNPGLAVFDGDHVHIMKDKLHGKIAAGKSDEVHDPRANA